MNKLPYRLISHVSRTVLFSVLLIVSFQIFAAPFGDIGAAVDVINPHSFEPGQIGQTLYNTSPQTQPSEIPRPTAPVKKTPPLSKAAAEAAKIKFVLKEVRISGNHVYSTETLLHTFTPYIHKEISVAKLLELVQDVTNKYQNDGYFLSKALLPPQRIEKGIVTVQVVEGFISNIDIKGVNDRTKQFISKYGDAIKAIKPIKLNELERYLLLLNDLSGFQVKSVIAPDPKIPLGAKLTLVSQVAPIQLTATRDNYQTRYLGPFENSIYGNLNSTILPGGSLFMRALGANNPWTLQYYEARHIQPIGVNGFLLSLDGYYTRTNPQFITAPLDVVGYSANGNMNVTYPVLRSRTHNLRLIGQFDYIDSHTNVLSQQLYFDRIRDITLSAQYDDLLWHGQNYALLSLDKGLPIFGANNQGVRSRLNANEHFLKLNATLSRTQFLNDIVSLYAMATGQYANSVLVASETFVFGGPYLGRGYNMSQFTTDEAVAGTLECRINTNPNLPFAQQVQLYAFYDVAKFWNRSPLISLVGQASAASAGFGTRATLTNHISAEGFLGRALTAPNATQVVLGRNPHTFLGYFKISANI